MTARPGGDALLDLLTEPSFVVTRQGEVTTANAAARRLLGADPHGRSLIDFVAEAPEDVAALLRRSGATTSRLVGSIVLRGRDGPLRMRTHSVRLHDEGAGVRIALRCFSARDGEFSLLARRVRDLNAQLRRRLHENAMLEESLSENRILMRELQHRVKNNVQMMMSLLTLSASGGRTPEVEAMLQTARLRLQAMASIQESIYQAQHLTVVPARTFLTALAEPIVQAVAPSARLHTDIAEVSLPHQSAHCLALIVNELLVNALKHGLGQGPGDVWLRLARADSGFELVIWDSGPGFAAEAAARSSGLRLVRGLCRQIGGSLELAGEDGARCTVRFGGEQGGS